MTGPGTARLHVTEILQLLGAIDGLNVFDAWVPPNPPQPYAVVYPDAGTGVTTSLAPLSDRVDTVFQVTAVGLTRDQAMWAAEHVSTALLDVTPSITGRACGPIAQLSAQNIRRDDKVKPEAFYTATTWRLYSVPA